MVILFMERIFVDLLSFEKTQCINNNDFRDLMTKEAGEKFPGMTWRDVYHQIHDTVNEYVM